jgi:hypothetical protein
VQQVAALSLQPRYLAGCRFWQTNATSANMRIFMAKYLLLGELI